jgi:hypothetical protein
MENLAKSKTCQRSNEQHEFAAVPSDVRWWLSPAVMHYLISYALDERSPGLNDISRKVRDSQRPSPHQAASRELLLITLDHAT